MLIIPFPLTSRSPLNYESNLWLSSSCVVAETWTRPGALVEHMRAAVLTASPQRSYWNLLWPMMPAMAAPEWMPI